MNPFGEVHWSDVRGRPVWRWATVTATTPTISLTVDGDEEPIGVEPTVLEHVGTIDAGDRVWCQIQPGGGVVVTGRSPAPGPRWLPYTPVLLGTTTDPAPGSGAIETTGEYYVDGEVVHVEIYVGVSGDWDRGSGFYQISLPVVPSRYSSTKKAMLRGEFAIIGEVRSINSAHGPIETETSVVNRVQASLGSGAAFESIRGWATPLPSSWEGRVVLSGTYRRAGSAPVSNKAFYVIPHQDEVLTCGPAILDDVADGRDVHVLLTSRGEKSGARTNTALTGPLGFTPTELQFSQARDREFVEAVTRLGATPIVPPYEQRQGDGVATPAGILALMDRYVPRGVSLRATSPHDYHVDHRACGEAVEQRAASGDYTDTRLYLGHTRKATHKPAGVTMQRTAGGITTYHTDPYVVQDIPAGFWGIGGISVQSAFNSLLNNDTASYWYPLGADSK